MSKFGRKIKQPPPGYEYIEPTITALENEIREKVNESHEGLRKNESQWPIHQINWQKSRYVYDMYYTYEKISKEVYDYCITNKIVDAALIAKWKKPGYERLCSTFVINPRNYKFGTVSICRVPKRGLAPGQEIEDPTTGCRGCASGDSHNIFGNKYGQYLAAIQIAREERIAAKQAQQQHGQSGRQGIQQSRQQQQESDDENDEDDVDDDDDEDGPVGNADGSGIAKKKVLWADDATAAKLQLTEDMIGRANAEAQREAMAALSRGGAGNKGGDDDKDGGGKRQRHG